MAESLTADDVGLQIRPVPLGLQVRTDPADGALTPDAVAQLRRRAEGMRGSPMAQTILALLDELARVQGVATLRATVAAKHTTVLERAFADWSSVEYAEGWADATEWLLDLMDDAEPRPASDRSTNGGQ